MKLSIQGHQQDDAESCGRACAQVIIGFERARLGNPGTVLPDQPAMAAAETNTYKGWATEPDELTSHISAGASTPLAAVWSTVICRPAPTAPDPDLDAATQLITHVCEALDRGFPCVMMTDANDHWEVVYGYKEVSGHVQLYAKDPVPITFGTPPFHHSDNDGCLSLDDVIWFVNSTDAVEFICDADPFKGTAIGVVQTSLGIVTLVDRRWGWVMPNMAPDPLVIRNTAAQVVSSWLREMVTLIGALNELSEPPPLYHLAWSGASLHPAKFVGNAERMIYLVGVRNNNAHERSLIISLRADGSLQRLRATRLHALTNAIAAAPESDPLWIVPEHGRWQPYQHLQTTGDKALLRRLHDGVETTVPAAALETNRR